MDKEKLAENIFAQAKVFKKRANKSVEDQKRHDLIMRDEKKVMRDAGVVLRWSWAKIGSVFDRDPRSVKQAIENSKQKEKTQSMDQRPETELNPVLTERQKVTPAPQRGQEEHLDNIRRELDDSVASRLYQQHQDGMILLVERLSADLEPHLSHFRLRSLEGRGIHSESVWQSVWVNPLSLTWRVEADGSVYLSYGLELAEDAGTKTMRGYFQQHLHSSSYFGLMEDDDNGINKWKRLAGEELKYRTRLLRNIDRAVEKLTSKPLADPNLMNSAGPLTWFTESIWAAVLDGQYNALHYKVEPIDIGLFKAQYGANSIGLTATKEEGGQYIEWHKNLMVKYEKSSMVKTVDQLKKDRELVTKGIRDLLTKIVVDKHMPGKCDYEFCR